MYIGRIAIITITLLALSGVSHAQRSQKEVPLLDASGNLDIDGDITGDALNADTVDTGEVHLEANESNVCSTTDDLGKMRYNSTTGKFQVCY